MTLPVHFSELPAAANIESETGELEQVLARHTGPVVLVNNEVGSGIVPDNALARVVRARGARLAVRADGGRAHCRVAAAGERKCVEKKRVA